MKTIAIVLFLILSVTHVCNAHPSPSNRVLTAHYNDPSTNCHVHEYEGGRGSWNIANGKVAGKWEFGDIDTLQTGNNNENRQPTQNPANTDTRTQDTALHSETESDTGDTDETETPRTDVPIVSTTPRTDVPIVSTTSRQPDAPVRTCPTITGYAIEVNDKGQIRISGEPTTAQLYLYFDGNETTFYTVLSGYVSHGRFEQFTFNEWADMDTLEIIDHRQPYASCRSCPNLSVADAVKMVLRIRIGVGLCPVAVYPETAPSAPSLIKPKLTTLWATLKK